MSNKQYHTVVSCQYDSDTCPAYMQNPCCTYLTEKNWSNFSKKKKLISEVCWTCVTTKMQAKFVFIDFFSLISVKCGQATQKFVTYNGHICIFTKKCSSIIFFILQILYALLDVFLQCYYTNLLIKWVNIFLSSV